MIGAVWNEGDPTSRLPVYAVPAHEQPAILPGLARALGVREFVYLTTCNRVEVVLVANGDTPIATYRHRVFRQLRGREPLPGEAAAELRAWGGEGAAEHLFRLAAGLESVMLGEREIVAQMRQALDEARAAGTAGPILEWLFEEAWKVGRRVHSSTSLGSGKVSLGEIALERARERLRAAAGAVVLVGVSPMTLHCARGLASEAVPVWICNRTLSKAEAAGREHGARALSLEQLQTAPPADVAVVILATSAPGPVLRRPHLERIAACRSGQTPLLIDMASPPDVDPEEARLVDLPRVGLDEILREADAHRRTREREGVAAGEIVEQALEGLQDKLVAGVLAPVLAALQRRYQTTARRAIERLLTAELPDLNDGDLTRLERWADVLARRFAHLPSTGLKALAGSYGLPAVETFLGAADEELHEELARLRAEGRQLLPGGVECYLEALRSPER